MSNSVFPRDITLNCNSEFWFDSPCGHLVLLKISHIARGKLGFVTRDSSVFDYLLKS